MLRPDIPGLRGPPPIFIGRTRPDQAGASRNGPEFDRSSPNSGRNSPEFDRDIPEVCRNSPEIRPTKSLFEKCICPVCLSIISLASLLLAYRYVPICSLVESEQHKSGPLCGLPRRADARRRIRSKAIFQTGSKRLRLRLRAAWTPAGRKSGRAGALVFIGNGGNMVRIGLFLRRCDYR